MPMPMSLDDLQLLVMREALVVMFGTTVGAFRVFHQHHCRTLC